MAFRVPALDHVALAIEEGCAVSWNYEVLNKDVIAMVLF